MKELQNFEMNLKQMIDEAKMLAESPGQSIEDLRNRLENRTPVRDMERSRSRKSESVVSVIELPPTPVVEEESEPMPMSRRGIPIRRSPQQLLQSPPPPQEPLEEQEQLPPPPLEEMEFLSGTSRILFL